ncbi:uncharacterized protein L201_004043 [Kwoniella dendrophila CBS 6074]|uniref:Uncharacterized protein n=1 Tax=Kwoniella dendrophila CBS 6074 TaxID=1295534 RepID=A0AAX4JUM0_9TREE
MPPSSPTPHRNLISLIPSSPPSADQWRKGQLRSSSTDTIIKGLSNWKRQAKLISQSTTTISKRSRQIDSPAKSDDGDDQAQGHGGKNVYKSRKISYSKSTSNGLGLGMGMRGTPAKRVKRNSKASIGASSTPLARKKISTQTFGSPSGHASSFANSTLPLSSAEEISSPSISDPGTSPIPPPPPKVLQKPQFDDLLDDVFNDPTISADNTRRQEMLFPAREDLVVPIHPVSYSQYDASSSSKANTPKTTTTKHIVALPIDQDDGWEFSIPLNDVSQPSQSTRKQRMPRSSDGSSKIKERRSTPRKLQGMDKTPSISDISDSYQDTTPKVAPQLTHENLPQSPQHNLSPETARAYTANRLRSPLRISSLAEDSTLNESHVGHDFDQHLDTVPIEFSPQLAGHEFSVSDEIGMQVSPDLTRIITGSRTINVYPSSTKDAYGFEWMQDYLRDKIPQPFCPSSEDSTPVRLSSPSPISFSSITTISVPPNSPSLNIVETVTMTRKAGRWQGAKLMKRIEATEIFEDEGVDMRDDVDDEYEHDVRNSRTEDRTQRRKSSRQKKDDRAELIPEAKQAREARLAHYIDLANNYQLHVEYVLG